MNARRQIPSPPRGRRPRRTRLYRLVLCLACGGLSRPETARADAPKPAPGATTIVLPPVAVMGKPIGSFGISVRVLRSEATQRALLITVIDVRPDSDAQRKGIGPGTEILSIDGIDAHEFRATFAYGSDLNAKLLQRRPGDRITLEILPIGTPKPKFVTLVEGLRIDRGTYEGPLNVTHVGIAGSHP
jgi:hypothetical protein